MNGDPRFDRARLRLRWDRFEEIGLTAARVADAASHLSRVREALDEVTVAVLARSCQFDGKVALIERRALIAAPREVGLRALARLLMVVSGHTYRPRFERLERVYDSLGSANVAKGCTLHGCRIARAPKAQAIFGAETVLIAPEPARRTRKGRELREGTRIWHSDAFS
jgi:hypothetical protein